MRPYALMIGAAVLAGAGFAGSAQAYEWGGGTCIGYGCARPVYHARPVYDGGYRVIRHYDDDDVGPRVRVYERRVIRHHDWDDDDFDD